MHGIEIDHCPNCRGVWLDRGELDKIIERANAYGAPFMGEHGHHESHDEHHEKRHDSHEIYGNQTHGYQTYGHHSKHKKGFFSELFDF